MTWPKVVLSALMAVLALAACAKGHAATVTPTVSTVTFSEVVTSLPFGEKSAIYDATSADLWVVTREASSVPGAEIVTLSQVDPSSGSTINRRLDVDLTRFVTSRVTVDAAGTVWIGIGRSIVRFEPSTAAFRRWDLPADLAPLPSGPDDGGVVTIHAEDAGLAVLVRGLPRMLMLSPAAASPWSAATDLSVTPYDFSQIVPAGDTELVSGVNTPTGQRPQPAVTRLTGKSSVTVPGLSACLAQPQGVAVCASADGALSRVTDANSPIQGAHSADVRLNLATTSAGLLWLWSQGYDSANVVSVDTNTAQQTAYSFPLEFTTIDRSKSLVSGVGGGPKPTASGATRTVAIDPGPQVLVDVGKQLWVLTLYGARVGEEGAKSAYAAAYRLNL